MPGTGPRYRGRFAPSPTGPLHLGSLIAALASFLDARQHAGQWLVRIEDLDPPREEPGAARRILRSLRCHGLDWDGELLWQSNRRGAYRRALAHLAAGGHLFYCDCARPQSGPGGACGRRCRERQAQVGSPHAIRVAVPPGCRIRYTDRLQGDVDLCLERELADFVVRRKDDLIAYQLAVVVDDAAQGITHVVRGSDLLDSTPRQICLQQLLGHPTPDYCHIPVITDGRGQKLSKQSLAPALDDTRAAANVRAALRFLRQPEPPGGRTTVAELLVFAREHWCPQAVPAALSVPAAGPGQ